MRGLLQRWDEGLAALELEDEEDEEDEEERQPVLRRGLPLLLVAEAAGPEAAKAPEEAGQTAAEAAAKAAEATAKAPSAAVEAPTPAMETTEVAKTAAESAAPKSFQSFWREKDPDYYALVTGEFKDCLNKGTCLPKERIMEKMIKASRRRTKAPAVETPAAVEAPAKAVEAVEAPASATEMVEVAKKSKESPTTLEESLRFLAEQKQKHLDNCVGREKYYIWDPVTEKMRSVYELYGEEPVVEAPAKAAAEVEAPAKAVEAVVEAPAKAAAEVVEVTKTAVESTAAGQQQVWTQDCLELFNQYFDPKGPHTSEYGSFSHYSEWSKKLNGCFKRWEKANPKTPAETPVEASNLAETSVETTAAAAPEAAAEVVEVTKTAVESAAAAPKGSGEPLRDLNQSQFEVCLNKALYKHPSADQISPKGRSSVWDEYLRCFEHHPQCWMGTGEKAAEVAKTPEAAEVAKTPEAAEVLEQWCHRTEVSGHELPPGTVGPAMESMAEIYQVYGFELGSLLLISLGILVQLLQLVLVGLMKLLGNNPRYPTEERVPSSGYECGFSPFAAISSSSLVVFRQLAVYFVVFEAELVFLYPWSASLLPGSLLGSALGYYGVVPFLACLVVGFALEIQRDALKL